MPGYKTASGNRCCNNQTYLLVLQCRYVTKPQAVIAVATLLVLDRAMESVNSYKTASGNRCCNLHWQCQNSIVHRYKTASGNRCCNSTLGNPCLERLFGDTLANQINVYHDSSEKRLFERLSPTPGSQNPYHARTS